MLFDPTADLANFGIPQLLYEPLASFIGWLVLMILMVGLLLWGRQRFLQSRVDALAEAAADDDALDDLGGVTDEDA